MAYFSQGDGRNKLMLLYFLYKIDWGLSRNQVYTIFAEQGWMEYFDFQSGFAQLEEDGFIAAISARLEAQPEQKYRVTPAGEAMLNLFQAELPNSIQEKLLAYAKENRALLMQETQCAAIQTQLPDGGSLAMLRLSDKSAPILHISLHLPDTKHAATACANWPKRAEAIYQEIIQKLFEEN